MKNTGASSIVCFTILVLSVLLDEEYWNNIGNTNIVKHTILEAPVFFIQQYCIVKHTILEAPVFFIQQYW
jgi:hypothetical protein